MRQDCISVLCFVQACCRSGQVAVLQLGLLAVSFLAARLPQDPSGLGGIDFVDGLSFAEVGRQTYQ